MPRRLARPGRNPRPQEAAAPGGLRRRRRVQTSLAQHPPLPGSRPQGRGKLQRGCPGGAQGQVGAEVRGQEGLPEVTAPHWALWPGREGLSPACLEMLDLLKGTGLGRSGPRCFLGPAHPVLGHLPPTASPQALSPEIHQKPCDPAASLPGRPSAQGSLWPLPAAATCTQGTQSHHQRLYSGTFWNSPGPTRGPEPPHPASEL